MTPTSNSNGVRRARRSHSPAVPERRGARASWQVLRGDCLQLLPDLKAETVHAVVCDPPYGINFQGARWDGRAIRESAATTSSRRRLSRGEAFQEWARSWAEGCLHVLKPGGHLVAFGSPRTFHRLACGLEDAGFELRDTLMWLYASGMAKSRRLAGGTGTALKPAWEPILLARKQPDGTVERNVRLHGTGALNIDACRIGERWPANVILTHHEHCNEQECATGCAVAAIDRADRREQATAPPSRLFFSAKVSRPERDAGCEHLPAGELNLFPNAQRGPAPGAARNSHPTVKPIELMRWLVALASPPGGLVLDPFCGSGSTGAAAVLEHRRFIGIEQQPAYVEIARARINRWAPGPKCKEGTSGPFAKGRRRRPRTAASPTATASTSCAAIETLAIRVAELLASRIPPQQPPPRAPGRLLSAAEVSDWWGVSRGWVYQHATELGVVRIGDGERPRLRFDPDRVTERLQRPPASPPPKAPQPRRRVRGSPRIRGDSRRLAFRADPELSSSHANRREPGGERMSPAAAPKTTASKR